MLRGPPFLLLAGVLLSGTVAFSGQHETCTMEGGKHKAHYHCPNGYEVVYTGEGELECDGDCYRKASQHDLESALKRIMDRKGITMSESNISTLAAQLIAKGEASVGDLVFRRFSGVDKGRVDREDRPNGK